MRRFFCATILEGEIELSPEQTHHLKRVLRIAAGEKLILFNEHHWCEAELSSFVGDRAIVTTIGGIQDSTEAHDKPKVEV